MNLKMKKILSPCLREDSAFTSFNQDPYQFDFVLTVKGLGPPLSTSSFVIRFLHHFNNVTTNNYGKPEVLFEDSQV